MRRLEISLLMKRMKNVNYILYKLSIKFISSSIYSTIINKNELTK